MLSIWQSFQAWLNKLFGARQAATPNSVISNSSMMQNVLDTVLLQARKVINRTVPQLEGVIKSEMGGINEDGMYDR
jgi:hypothetical protein